MVEKARDNRMRRVADRRGYRLTKSRRRDPRATDFGLYTLVWKGNLIRDVRRGMTLDEVERFLDEMVPYRVIMACDRLQPGSGA